VVLAESVSCKASAITGAIFGVQNRRTWLTCLSVFEDSCSLYDYSMSIHLNQSYGKNYAGITARCERLELSLAGMAYIKCVNSEARFRS